jgi:hypothetical protein
VATLDGARIVESFATRGGGMHNCMTGCIVQCSNVVHDKDGNYKTSALEFETLTLLGANCGIASWEDVADLDRLCDEVGLDTIETGAAIATLRTGRRSSATPPAPSVSCTRSPRARNSARRSATARFRSARSASTRGCRS